MEEEADRQGDEDSSPEAAVGDSEVGAADAPLHVARAPKALRRTRLERQGLDACQLVAGSRHCEGGYYCGKITEGLSG